MCPGDVHPPQPMKHSPYSWEKISLYPPKFLMTYFSVIYLQICNSPSLRPLAVSTWMGRLRNCVDVYFTNKISLPT